MVSGACGLKTMVPSARAVSRFEASVFVREPWFLAPAA